jgi:hypothetical protein
MQTPGNYRLRFRVGDATSNEAKVTMLGNQDAGERETEERKENAVKEDLKKQEGTREQREEARRRLEDVIKQDVKNLHAGSRVAQDRGLVSGAGEHALAVGGKGYRLDIGGVPFPSLLTAHHVPGATSSGSLRDTPIR